jgi:hypothetical protein
MVRKVDFMCRYLGHFDSADGWYALACLLAKADTTATVHGCRVDYKEALRRCGRQALEKTIQPTPRRCDELVTSLKAEGVNLVSLSSITAPAKLQSPLSVAAFQDLWELHCFLEEYAAVIIDKDAAGNITTRHTAGSVRRALCAAVMLPDAAASPQNSVVVDALRIAGQVGCAKTPPAEPIALPPLAAKYSVVRERMHRFGSATTDDAAGALATILMNGGRLALQTAAADVAGTEQSWSALQADPKRWQRLVDLFPRAGTHPEEFRLDLLRLAVTNGEVFSFFGGSKWWELGHMLETYGSTVANGVTVDASTCFEAQLNSMIDLTRCPKFWLSMAEDLRLGKNRRKVRVKGVLYERQGCLEMAYSALLHEPKDEAELELTRACLRALLSVYRQCQSKGHSVKLDAESAQARLDALATWRPVTKEPVTKEPAKKTSVSWWLRKSGSQLQAS